MWKRKIHHHIYIILGTFHKKSQFFAILISAKMNVMPFHSMYYYDYNYDYDYDDYYYYYDYYYYLFFIY